MYTECKTVVCEGLVCVYMRFFACIESDITPVHGLNRDKFISDVVLQLLVT
jgi:hypothetical protein